VIADARSIAAFLPVLVFFRQLFGAAAIFSPVAADKSSPLSHLVGIWFFAIIAGGWTAPSNDWLFVAGSIGLIGALALFEWARHSIRRHYFSYVFSGDTPTFVHTGGPFAYVRNPFYASYLLSMASTTLMFPTTIRGLIVLAGAVYFWSAARYEERKFANSPVAEEFERYRRRSGRFIPRLSRNREDRR
jgi:protein-S-isoprenylcysteine O-methyltransferase Ste14